MQNAAARFPTGSYSPPYWLLVSVRAYFKASFLVFKALHGLGTPECPPAEAQRWQRSLGPLYRAVQSTAQGPTLNTLKQHASIMVVLLVFTLVIDFILTSAWVYVYFCSLLYWSCFLCLFSSNDYIIIMNTLYLHLRKITVCSHYMHYFIFALLRCQFKLMESRNLPSPSTVAASCIAS